IDKPQHPRRHVHDLELHLAEMASLENTAVEPPGRRCAAIEVEHRFECEPIPFESLAKRGASVALLVGESVVEGVIEAGVLRYQDDRSATLSKDAVNVP